MKWLTVYEGGGAVTSSGSPISATSITAGTGTSNRVGAHVRLIDLSYSSLYQVGDSYNTIRQIVFAWNVDDNSEAPSVASLLDNTGPSGYPTVWQYRQDTKRKYTILRDEVVRMETFRAGSTPSDSVYGSGNCTRFITGVVPLNGRKVEFTSATGGIGKIYVLFVSDSSVLPNPSVVGQYQLRYEDADGL